MVQIEPDIPRRLRILMSRVVYTYVKDGEHAVRCSMHGDQKALSISYKYFQNKEVCSLCAPSVLDYVEGKLIGGEKKPDLIKDSSKCSVCDAVVNFTDQCVLCGKSFCVDHLVDTNFCGPCLEQWERVDAQRGAN